MSKIIESWAFLEMLAPGEVPSFSAIIRGSRLAGGKDEKGVIPFSQATNIREKIKPANSEKDTVTFSYYMDGYEQYELIQFMRDFFKSEEEVINKSSKLCYSFAFDANEVGAYIEDSIFIPQLQLIVHDIQTKNKVQYSDFTERYNESRNRLEEEVRTLFSAGVDEASIEQVRQAFYRYFGSIHKERPRHFVECDVRKKDAPESSPKFNSFYLDDLQKVIQEGPNETLHDYLTGKKQTLDVDENQTAIEEMLLPQKLPIGRWPSPLGHRLSLMQQVAVNQVINSEERISSVNGPPGTGKTTLLKDIFAQLIVDRAIQMATYGDPTKAFTNVGKQDIKGFNKTYTYNMFALAPEIAKYSMVVTSSNNGAVENISKELPMLEEIIRVEEKPSEEARLKAIEETGIDPIYEYAYAEEAKELDLFSDIAEDILGNEKAWGLFSAAFGRSANIRAVSSSLNNRKKEQPSFIDILKEPLETNAWTTAVNEFNDLRRSIEHDQKELQDYVLAMQEAEQLLRKQAALNKKIQLEEEGEARLKNTLDLVQGEKEAIQERLDYLPKPSFVDRIKHIFKSKEESEEDQIREQLNAVLEEQQRLVSDTKKHALELEQLRVKSQALKDKLAAVEVAKEQYKDENVVLSTSEFWSEAYYEERQKAVLWQTNELNFKRGLLFLKALKVQKVFLKLNSRPINATLALLRNLRSINLNIEEERQKVENMWQTLHLIFPLMSTTFASFSTMYRGMGKDFIGYLFIDEAGQASPQQAAGALWRSKRAIIVGDPIQIEPVVTMDETILSDIRKAFGVSERYIGSTASVQTVADHANPIGTYKGSGEDKERIGIPLWVHRRCIEPMFAIANEIAYDNKMVLANQKVGKGHWYDVDGKALQAQYVKEQGEFIVQQIEQSFEAHEGEGEPSIFVITPFTAVKSELKHLLDYRLKRKFPNFEKWTTRSIGTVHTFQGKEADIVYFVTGTDIDTDGAANWSCMKPNLLNVAVTRAKKAFYVVGDLERFKEKQYYNVIQSHFERFKNL